MPSIVDCNNKDCVYYDDCCGCDADKLVIYYGVCAGSAGHGRNVSQNDLDERLRAENLQLRQRMDRLIRILNNDYDLSIQLDGLRKFWHVGLTDEGVRKRDERDAEVGLLRDQNEKLRQLVRDMWRDGMCDCDELVAAQGEYHCAECEYHYPDRMRELGIEIEVDDD